MLDVHVDQPMEDNIFSFLNVFQVSSEDNIQTFEYTNFIFSGSDIVPEEYYVLTFGVHLIETHVYDMFIMR